MKIRVAACQISTSSDIPASTTKILKWIAKAAKKKVDAVSFPEGTVCGYVSDKAFWKSVDRSLFKKAERRIASAAKRNRIAVVFGTAHWEGDKVYNDLLILDRDGKVRGRYSKIHLAERWPAPGRKLLVRKIAGVKSCFIICHDVRYPELVRLPAASGAQICWFCSNESGLVFEHKLSAYKAMPVSRATENGVFLVMANAPAEADNIQSGSQSHGNSKIIHPDGNVLIEAGYFEERLVMADIDLTEADRRIALRSLDDDTPLQAWMKEGVKLVDG